jgi:hypothetical protein
VRRSDKRVPHEVLPAKSFRYAITTWFMSSADAAEARAKFQHQVCERAERFVVLRACVGVNLTNPRLEDTFTYSPLAVALLDA